MWSFDIFKQWGFPEQDKFNKGIGYTQGGGAGDMSGEAAMFDQYGKQVTSGIIQQKRQKKGHKKGVMENVNMVPNPYGAPKGQITANAPDAVKTGQAGATQQNLDWLGRLTGVNMDEAKKRWENKGGFEGLMANPAFTMGLAFMQAGAEGKTLGAGAMDNVIKAAGISSNYKRLMEAKAGGVKEVTTGQMDKIKSVLKTKGFDKPGWWRKIRPGNQSESYEQAVEDIAFKVQAKVDAMVKSAKASGKSIEVGNRLYKKVVDQMIASGEIKSAGGVNIGGYQIVDKTLEAPNRARGGPITKGKPYMVGEQGPEVVIPRESAKVLSNDDSRIFAMLLAANPQLQKVSKTRAEKILRNRFPEYFE